MSHHTATAPANAAVLPENARASFLREALLRAFAEMKRGRLVLELPDGSLREFGAPAGSGLPELPLGISASARLVVKRETFFKKCVLAGDIGFGEAFVDGDWETPDLTALVAWFILNLDHAPTLSGSQRARSVALNFLRFANRVGHLLRPNSRATARRNISEHYDLSNDFFALMLDPSMMYSGARWAHPDQTLQQAQWEKNEALCRKLKLRPSDHVLEIGSGWGGWSLHAAKNHGCRVTTVTISRQQYDLARQRVAAAGLSERIDVQFCDYRDLAGKFDKVVSIEMMEAIGHRYLPAFAATIDRVLKRDGLLALQFITCPDSRYAEFRRGVDYIQKHIFPGSLLLSLNRVNDLLSKSGGFILHTVEDQGHDYVRTLRAWETNFRAKHDQVRALGFDERFIRKWSYYLGYCQAAFAMRNISVVQTLHTRANNLSL
jgi:cyclopropane-fatty-acyl-phospholipid synthase